MSFKVPSLEEMHETQLAMHKVQMPDDDISSTSDNWKRQRTTALAVTSLHAHIAQAERDALPDTSDPERQDRWGAIYNVPRKGATAASAAAALRVFGTPGSGVVIGSVLAHVDGTTFQTNSAGTVGGGGFLDVDVLSLTLGSIAKKAKGEILTFLAAPPGIVSVAELQADIDRGGDDVEGPGSFKVRLLDKTAQPGMGGNANDYVKWQLANPGVATAYTYPLRQGLGTVDMAFLHSGRGSVRIPSAPEIAAVQAYVDTQRPVAMAMDRVITVVAEPNDVEILVSEISASFAFDWDDTLPPTVSAWNGTARVLTFSARPADLVVKDRLTYRSAAPNDGSELTVEALGPGAQDVTVVALTTAQAAAPPVAGNTVYSGGPLVETLRQAILAHMDQLGPARGTNPKQVAGVWEDTLRISRLKTLAQLTTGVLDSNVITPAANVAPANVPPVGQVGLIIPRRVLVRRGA